MPHLHFPHVWMADRQYPYNRAHAPSSTLHSNVEDMCKYILMSLNRGELNGTRILTEASFNQLWDHSYPTNSGKDHNAYVGLSWFSGTYKGTSCVGHSGGDRGFQSHLLLFPEEEAGLICLMNALPAPEREITSSIADLVLGQEVDPSFLKKPIIYPMGKVLMQSGAEAAIDLYRQLQAEHPDEYYCDVEQFQFLLFVLVNVLEKAEDAGILEKFLKEEFGQ